MLEEPDAIPRMTNFIRYYPDAFQLFKKHDFNGALLYRQENGPHSEKILILVFERYIPNPNELVSQSGRIAQLSEELKKYFTCEFRVLSPSHLKPKELRRLSFPTYPSVLLTPDLLPTALEARLVEIFGVPWVYGQDAWIKEERKKLQESTKIAREKLRSSLARATSYLKISTVCRELSTPSETYFLTRVIFQRIEFHDEAVTRFTEALSTTPTLKHLRLRHNNITGEQAKKFSQALKKNTSLISFDISHNQVGYAVKHFGHMLQVNSTLESLSVGRNGCDFRIAYAFAKGLAKNKKLNRLRLNHCNLDHTGIGHLVEGLCCNQTLTSLNLAYNSLAEYGITEIIRLIEQSPNTWLSLNLSGNKVNDRTAKALAEMVRKNSSLVKLKLSHCHFTHEGLEDLLAVLTENQTVRKLDLHGNSFSYTTENWLIKILAQNTTLTSLHLTAFCASLNEIFPLRYAMKECHSLRRLVVHGETLWGSLVERFGLFLKNNHVLTGLEFPDVRLEKKSTKKIHSRLKRNQQAISQRRKELIYILIVLNHAFPLWKLLPLDIKLLIIDLLNFHEKTDIGKNKAQIHSCANFLFTHSAEYHAIIKAKQKLIILEKLEPTGNYTFRFFNPTEKRMPVTALVEKNSPIALFQSRFN